MNLEDLSEDKLKEYNYLYRNFELIGFLATDNEITFTIEPYINKKGVFKYRVFANCNYTEEEALKTTNLYKSFAYPFAEAKELYITGTYKEIVNFLLSYKLLLKGQLYKDFLNFERGLLNEKRGKKRND